jgi:hypothetical protein
VTSSRRSVTRAFEMAELRAWKIWNPCTCYDYDEWTLFSMHKIRKWSMDRECIKHYRDMFCDSLRRYNAF